MCSSIKDIVGALGSAVAAFDPSRLTALEASDVMDAFARAERLAAAGRMIATGRAMETKAWHGTTYRTPAQWIAAKTQAQLCEAIDSINTAESLASLPATREALVSGRLSEPQVAQIAGAAIVDRNAEESLLRAAEVEDLPTLRERCRVVKAAALGDEDATERIRRTRYFRHRIEADGAIRVDGRFAPDDGARLLSVVERRADAFAADARRSGRRESAAAYKADAIISLVDGKHGPKAVVNVHVDADALERGHTEAGEECTIPGIGPISVEAAQRFARSGVVKVLASAGVDIKTVAHARKDIPAHIETALIARDRNCVAPDCGETRNLEIDHIIPREEGGLTTLKNLCRLCGWHHYLKTHHGWRVEGSGDWAFLPPVGRSPPDS